MTRFDLVDHALRALIILAGMIAGVLLFLKGQAQSLPALALGGVLGVLLTQLGVGENQE